MAHNDDGLSQAVADAVAQLRDNVEADKPSPFNSGFMFHKKGCPRVSVDRGGEVFVFEGHAVEVGQTLGFAFSQMDALARARHVV